MDAAENGVPKARFALIRSTARSMASAITFVPSSAPLRNPSIPAVVVGIETTVISLARPAFGSQCLPDQRVYVSSLVPFSDLKTYGPDPAPAGGALPRFGS